MFSEVVFVEEGLGDGLLVGVYDCCAEGHSGDLFKDDGGFNGLCGACAPGEGAVVCDEDGGHLEGVNAAKAAYDSFASVQFIIFCDLVRSEGVGEWDGAVEVVGGGGAVTWYLATGLGPHCGVGRVGVADAGDVFEVAVELEVGLGVGRWVEGAFDGVAAEVEDDDFVGGEFGVGDAAGLDGDDAFVAVDAADVAPTVDGEVSGLQFEVGLADGVSQVLVHR